MQLDVVTLFPRVVRLVPRRSATCATPLASAATSCARFNPREHTPLSGGQVDDTPFGGGAGHGAARRRHGPALRGIYGGDPVDLRHERRVIALTPGGRMLDDALVDELAAEPAITLLCGRYEGFDERIVQHFASDAVSVGRYVLSGGELAAMVVMDAVLRKLPGRARPRRLGAWRSPSARRWAATPSTRTTPGPRSTAAGGSRGPALGPPRGDPHAGGARAASERGAATG